MAVAAILATTAALVWFLQLWKFGAVNPSNSSCGGEYERYFGFQPVRTDSEPTLPVSHGAVQGSARHTTGLSSHKGIVVMTGEAGTGKTTT